MVKQLLPNDVWSNSFQSGRKNLIYPTVRGRWIKSYKKGIKQTIIDIWHLKKNVDIKAKNEKNPLKYNNTDAY